MKHIAPYFIIAALLIYIICGGKQGKGDSVTIFDTVTYMDAIPYYYPVLKDSVVIRSVPARLPIISESVPKISDSVPKIADSVPRDSVLVQVPITQKVYEDSTYKAYVSGFRPNLDSLIFYNKRQVITTAPPNVKPHRWHIGPSVGVGMTTKGVQPTIGVTLTYSIWSW